MTLLKIDESKCKKDGFCVSDCPVKIIRLQGGDGYPELVPGGDAVCLVCGHCVAVCPHGALSHERVPLEDCPPIEKGLTISEEQAVQFFRSRRSIRVYEERPVETEKVQRLIEIARYAPTGSNTQMVEWLAFNGKDKVNALARLVADWIRHIVEKAPDTAPYPIERLRLFLAAWDAGSDTILRSAPTVVIATAPEEVGNGIVDPTIALTYLELAAPTLGLGTCWAGLLRRALLASPSLRETVGLSDRYPHYYPMMLGYPKIKYYRVPERRAPKITWK
jgi:nitroreductase/NAD-dependent dihydropyrimidine dehydrogenase PreA subunit